MIIKLPKGNNQTRPFSLKEGIMRPNYDKKEYEVYSNGEWVSTGKPIIEEDI